MAPPDRSSSLTDQVIDPVLTPRGLAAQVGMGGLKLVADAGGGRLALAHEGGLRLLDLEGGAARRPVLASVSHAAPVGGARVIVAQADGAVALVDVEAGSAIELLSAYKHGISSIAVDAAGRRLALGGARGRVVVIDLETRQVLFDDDRAAAEVHAITFGRQPSALVTGHGNSQIWFWDLVWSKHVPAAWHQRAVLSVAADPMGLQLLSGGQSGQLGVWSPDTAKLKGWLEGHEGPVTALGHGARDRFASGDERGNIRLWKRDFARAGEAVTSLAPHQGPVRGLRFTEGDDVLLSWCRDEVRFSRASDGAALRSLSCAEPRVLGVSATEQGTFAALIEPWGAVRVIDLETSRTMCVIEQASSRPTAFAAWRGGGLFATGNEAGEVSLYANDGALLSTVVGHDRRISALARSPAGDAVATAGVDGRVCVWSCEGARLEALARWSCEGVRALAFDPPGRALATGGENELTVRSVATREALLSRQARGATAVAFSPDGERVAWGAADCALRWASLLDTDKAGRRWTPLRPPASVAFSPDGRLLAAALERSVMLLDAASFEPLAEVRAHGTLVKGVAFASAKRLVTWAETIRTWDVGSFLAGRGPS